MKTFMKSLLMLILLFAFADLRAQIKFGPEVGVNLSTMTLKSSGLSLDPKMIVGFHAGVISEIGLVGNLSLQPGILFSVKGSEYEITVMEQPFTLSIKPSFIEVPVNLVYGIGPGNLKILLFAGPYFAYGIGGKTEGGGVSEDISFGSGENDDLKPFDIGVNIGAGVTISRILISAQYGIGLANLSPDSSNDTEMKNGVFGVSLGYLFGGK